MLDPGPGRSVASAAVAADPLLPHVSRADALVEEAVTVGSRGDVRAAWRLLEVRCWWRAVGAAGDSTAWPVLQLAESANTPPRPLAYLRTLTSAHTHAHPCSRRWNTARSTPARWETSDT